MGAFSGCYARFSLAQRLNTHGPLLPLGQALLIRSEGGVVGVSPAFLPIPRVQTQHDLLLPLAEENDRGAFGDRGSRVTFTGRDPPHARERRRQGCGQGQAGGVAIAVGAPPLGPVSRSERRGRTDQRDRCRQGGQQEPWAGPGPPWLGGSRRRGFGRVHRRSVACVRRAWVRRNVHSRQESAKDEGLPLCWGIRAEKRTSDPQTGLPTRATHW